jgi:hypothetical protein
MTETLAFPTGQAVFTDVGRGWLTQYSNDGKQCLVQLENATVPRWLDCDTVRTVAREIKKRTTDVYAEAMAVQAAAAALVIGGKFPDYSNFYLPQGPREKRLSAKMKNLQDCGVYRPEQLNPKFLAHLIQVAAQSELSFYWPLHAHPDTVPILKTEGIVLPDDVRPMREGTRVPGAKPAGGAQGYITFPEPADPSIMTLEFFHPPTEEGRRKATRTLKTGERRVTIGNFRLVLGLNKADSKLWPIPWLTEDKKDIDNQPTLCYA